MKHTFKRAMSLFMALAMVLTMVPSFGTHVHAEELETEPVVMTEEPATEAPVVEAPETEAAETEAPTQAPETEAPATEAPVVETEAPEVTEEAPEVVETEPAEETEAIEETFPEEILEEEIVEEEAVAEALSGGPGDIGLDGVATYWTVNGAVVKGSVTGRCYTATRYGALSTELIITNNMATQATLGFDFVASGYFSVGSTVTIDGVTYAAETSSSYEKQLDAGASITIKLSAANTSTNNKGINTVNLDITNLSLAVKGISVTTTFQAPGYGSYTVSYGEEVQTIAAGGGVVEIANDSSVKYTLTAIPGDGNKFIGWYDVNAEKYISTTTVCVTTFSGASTIKPIIVPNATAVFQVGNGNYFVDLDDAASYAEKNSINQITLIDSGYVYDAEYTIPAGVTLLIPRDDAYTPQASKPDYSEAHTAPTPYMTLTLAKDTKIVVKGSVEVEAIHTTTQGSKLTGNRPCGPYGAIYMNVGSNITLEDDAALYAWGYVYGEGSVTVNSGAKVYEYMQVTDFPGGTNLSKFADMDLTSDADGDEIPDNDYVKTFPLSQYYVQNVEVPMTLYAGAVEYVYATITAGGQSLGMPVEFIGNSGMFVPASGCIIKDYDEKTDRMIVDVYGNASVAGIVLDFAKSGLADSLLAAIAGVLGDTKFDSSRYIFGLNSNITINVNEGTTTIKQDIALFPGVEINIAQNAVLAITAGESHNITVFGTGGNNVYAYDLDQWGNFVFNNKKLSPVSYSPSKDRYTRTVNDLKDVVIDVNGKIIADGYLYSTVAYGDDGVESVSGGAAIISSQKTGVVAMNNGAGAEMLMYRLDGTSSRDDMSTIESAWLKNGDGTFVKTVGAEPGATFNYCAPCDAWHASDYVHKAVEITWANLGYAEYVTEEYEEIGAIPEYKGATPTKATANCKAYTFAGWKDQDGKEYPTGTALPAATTDATYFAYFTESDAHSFTTKRGTEITAGTCMTEAVYAVKCDNCDAENTGKTVKGEKDPTNHTKKNTYVEGTKEATCGAEGYTGDTYCECGEKIATGETIPATGNHNYVNEVARTAATCMAEGSVTKKCGCGAQITETLEIDPTNHTKQNTTVKDAVEATCGAEGYTGDTYCECGEKIATGETIPATGNHNYVTEVDRTAATCMAEGSVTKKCGCGAQITETLEIDPTNHTKQNTTVKDAVEATCGAAGYTGDTYCECGEKIADGKTIPATGAHVDGDDENHDCDNCPATGIEGHTPGAAVEEDRLEATCGAAGSYNTVVYCSECGEMLSSTANTIPATGKHVDGDDANHDCDNCPATEVDGGCHGGEATCQGPAVCDECDSEYGDLDPENHASDAFTYENVNWDGTHVKSHECCGVVIDEAEPCNYTTGEEEHTCACGQVEHFILTIEYIAIDEDGEWYLETKKVSVPYGAPLSEIEEIAGLASEIYVNAFDTRGVYVLDGYAFGSSDVDLAGPYEIEELTMPGSDAWLRAEYILTGWTNYGEGWVYVIENEIQMTGWTAFDDGEGGEDWYYLDPETGIRAEGVARVPYPTEPINGFKYGPNEEDMANTDYNYPDATEAWFVFASGTENGENDGKFLNNYSGPANTDKDLISWAVKGMIPWHVGMVQLDENVYAYFIGDEVNGGNVMATGDVYVIRVADNCERAFAIGGIYTFGENGLLIDNHGIVDMGNGTKRYYQNAQLMAGAGLIEVPVDNNDNYAFIFVRGNGELVVNTKYWVGANDLNVVPGLYAFDENGYMINPAPADKNGVFAEDGALYFYENGKRTYKGLIEYGDGIIYVTTSGKLATGKYYVTKTDLIEGYEPGFYFFDEEGYMEITTRNGIVDGKFYVDGEVQYGAGLIEYNDGLIYVKSNGQVVMDQAYWITNTNNLLPAGCYEFDSEGYLQIDESLDGVVGLNYYIDGVKQFGNGLVKVEDGYIYVKTNGELATGTYWITRTNGLMSAGCYEFDTDGYMILG